MNEVTKVLLYTTLAGAAIPVGGHLARIERLRPLWLEQELRHGVLAFGGGVLLAAVALVLVPEGVRALTGPVAVASLLAGGAVFMAVDRSLARRGTAASNLLAALLDFAPEAIALGAMITAEPALGALLAFFIALQNLPEGFNAYREMVTRSRLSAARTLAILSVTVVLGPICGLLGLWLLSDHPGATGLTMLFASGGILYLTFQDIAPQVPLERHWGPPLGAVLGFSVGLTGQLVLGH